MNTVFILDFFGGNYMLKCSECQRDLPEKEALVNKTEEGKQRIICPVIKLNFCHQRCLPF